MTASLFKPVTAGRLALLALLLLAQTATAQQIEAKITMDVRTLPIERQQKLRDFAEKVENYINSHQWNNDPWRTVIYLTMNIILEDMTTSAEERFKGQLLLSNSYDCQFSDKRWRFAYDSGEPLVHDENMTNSFTNMLDFYINLVLGVEFDKWSTLGGTEYYVKARNIAEQSKFGLGRFIEGWDRRLDLAVYLLSDEHKPFREMCDYYYYGLSLVKQDNAKVRQYVAIAIDMLDKILSKNPENEYAKNFIEAHYIEMVDIYRRAENKEPLRTLMVIDPKHADIYCDILEK